MKGISIFASLLFAGFVIATSDSVEDSLKQLKEAVSKQDPSQVKKLATETCALARQLAAQPAPEDAAEKDVWKQRVDFARDTETYTEYALYSTAVQGKPAVTVDLLSTLEKQNPNSKYLGDVYGRYILAMTQSGAESKVIPMAEAAVSHFPSNEDLLLVLANSAMNRKQTDRAINYAQRLVSVMGKHPTPAGMSAADWERKRASALARGYWIAGVMQVEKTQYFEGNKSLRAALPLVAGDENMKASTLFYLGVANYQLGSAMRSRAQVLEAAKFSAEAAAIKGPLSYQAWKNSEIMKTEAQKLR